jgi:hypothetical protein
MTAARARTIPPPPEPTPIYLHGKPSRARTISVVVIFTLGFGMLTHFLALALWAAVDPPRCGVKRDLFSNCRADSR